MTTDSESSGQSLYAEHEKVYPRSVHGAFATLRTVAVFALLGLFYGVAWLHWNGQQLLVFDLPARKFHIFGLVLFPQDFLYLTGLMILAALSLFFFTALAGRLWCGYACPQTVYTEVFLWIERLIEGDRPRQLKLAKAPWTVDKLRRKLAKHSVWILFSLWTGFTFVGYFTPIVDLGNSVLDLSLGPWEVFWLLFYAFATYGNAGWMREQVCIYMCPYARFQSAMFDDDTLVISYDQGRGEPRGSRQRGSDLTDSGKGDCIDCTMCVQVCPTGIDIREGMQYQCIACAACIDVCDQVMDKMNYDPGLIRYTSHNAIEGKPARILRPRVLIYFLGLIVLAGAMVTSLAQRTPLAMDVIRDRNALYRELAVGMVENVYTLKLINMDTRDLYVRVSLDGTAALTLVSLVAGIAVPAGEVVTVPAVIRADPADLEQASTAFRFVLQTVDRFAWRIEEEARFLAPH